MKKTNSTNRNSILVIFIILLFSFSNIYAQGFHERKMKRLEESSKVKSVKGGESILVNVSYDNSYEKLLTFLKRRDESIELANKETGQIASGITIEGGYKQKGTRIQFTLIKESDNTTTVKVQVNEMKRYKGLGTEPWSDPKLNEEKTKALIEEVKSYLL